MSRQRVFLDKEPEFAIKIISRKGFDVQGEIKHIESGAQEEFSDLLELSNIMGKLVEKLNPDLAMGNVRSWDNDEGSVDKQGERLFKFMRSLKPF